MERIRGTTLIDVRVVSRERPLVWPRAVGLTASLLAPHAAVQVAAGGVNSGSQGPWAPLNRWMPSLSVPDASPEPLRHRLTRYSSTFMACTQPAGKKTALLLGPFRNNLHFASF